MNTYLFASERLGFRNWKTSDIDLLYQINNNDTVMEFFPSKPSLQNTKDFITRMQDLYAQEKYCYFAVETLETNDFIGFIGFGKQIYEADFNPSTDIGWRLHPNFWGKGYATEGAKACLTYAFKQLNLSKIVSVAPKINLPSIKVMQKINMTKVKDFKHPLLKDYAHLETCVLFEITSSNN